MQGDQHNLYRRLLAYDLNNSEDETGFVEHLMRANGWGRDFACRAVEEYKKFVFLAMVADHQVTPSDQVDQVWHLHLLYSEAYWNDFCPRVLGRPLHHHPSKGGAQERAHFHQLYQATIASYHQIFGPPPADIWPPADVRFSPDLLMQRVPIGQRRRWRWHWSRPVASRPIAGWAQPALAPLLTLLLVLLLTRGALAQGADDAARMQIVPPLIVLLAFINLISMRWLPLLGEWIRVTILDPTNRKLPDRPPALAPEMLAYLATRKDGVITLALANLVDQGILQPRPESRELDLQGLPHQTPSPLEQRMLKAFNATKTRIPYRDLITPSNYASELTDLRQGLQSQRLIIPMEFGDNLVKAVVALLFILLGLNLIIVVLVVATQAFPWAMAGLLLPLYASLGVLLLGELTCLGQNVLAQYRERADHHDWMMRVALNGPEALSGGSLDQLKRLIQHEKEELERERREAGCSCG